MADSGLARKLLLKPGASGAVLNAPPGYLERIGPGLGIVLRSQLDFVQLFARNRAELQQTAPDAVSSIKPDGLLWVCYPKGGEKAGTDLNRDLLWEAMQPYGVTGVSLVSVDDIWSAMRFRPADKVVK